MVKISPRKIKGRWKQGWVLELHSTDSNFLGHDEFGHPQFETVRTEVGELLYRLKYKGDAHALPELVDVATWFLHQWSPPVTGIVPVPPTNAQRRLQPVILLARALGERLPQPVLENAIRRTKQYAELKSVQDPEERRRLLDGAFEVNAARVHGHHLLLLDDLYRSGATINAIGEALVSAGAEGVYALALTQTRRRL